MSEAMVQVEKLNKVFTDLKNKESEGKPLTKAELALGHIIGSVDDTHQCNNVYEALKKAGYIK